ncbi:AAA family ATPase [Schleiferia thermophila]|jgi:MoxR-like ATPase|uniref:MoxR-like ATPase n=1 Tax=Schleiferia thermophila TaxID=884107 RepID=A0A369A757_9FLAO|nr:AAA family ATPase [Schleiferia thermophila]KFD39488.1 ATPase AAA [Schleiferia thermophila str. Yellowstone]PMB34826.1 ATPase [Fischerella thermalis CCMEE 5319]RCX04981.1 MoxR-like ATPase [Schleiferia thermophila]GCD79501.1 ATPase AAA [Schleiferia thermophila]
MKEQTEEFIASYSLIEKIKDELSKVLIGQEYMVDRLLIGLISSGHILLEGVPGLAKTLTIKSLASCFDAKFSRIQFTPDLLPSDVIGTQIYNIQSGQFSVKLGPIFGNFILADEINRAPAKVQSALLEAMQEKQVTIGEETYFLKQPFLVLATQNPLEQEGTYPLPEAQLDRFFMKVVITYPSYEEELKILKSYANTSSEHHLNPVATVDQIFSLRQIVQSVYMDEKLERYIVDLVIATRSPQQYGLAQLKPLISYGVSPRGTIALAKAARAMAFLQERTYVLPDDIKAVINDVFRHRIGLTYEAEAEELTPEFLIEKVLNQIQVP